MIGTHRYIAIVAALVAAGSIGACYRAHERPLDASVPRADALVLVDARAPRPLEPQWTELHPTGEQPCIRYSHFAVYDASRDVMWIGGGRRWFETCEGARHGQGWLDVWRLELSTDRWARAGTLPHGVAGCSAHGGLAAVFDATRDRIVVPSACAPGEDIPESDVPGSRTGGVLDLATMEWRDTPAAEESHAVFVVDAGRDRAIAADGAAMMTLDLASLSFGRVRVRGEAPSSNSLVGAGDRFFSIGHEDGRAVIGALDVSAETWSIHRGTLRTRGITHTVWDTRHRRILGFSGQDGGPLEDHWLDRIAGTYVIDPTVVDGVSEHLVPMPRPRTHATFVWDEVRSRALLFGGRASYGPRSFADVWALELVPR